MSVDDQPLLITAHCLVVKAVIGIVFEQMSQRLVVSQVVNSDDFDVIARESDLERIAPNTPKPIDRHSCFHVSVVSFCFKLLLTH
jgi:hypothetical protein